MSVEWGDVIAIDPGYEVSAWVRYDGARVREHGIEPNAALLDRLRAIEHGFGIGTVAIEGIESFGMAVGKEVFETVFWTGRFYEVALRRVPTVERVYRKTVKLHLCQSARAQDTNIRVALMDRFGGTKAIAIGIKAAPGPLFGIKSHEWSALALAVTWWDQHHTVTERQIAHV